MRRILARLPKTRRIGGFLTFARFVVERMRNNPEFPDITPTVAQVEAHLEAAELAHTETFTRRVGTVAARNSALAVLRRDLLVWKTHIEAVAARNPATAEATIRAAGFDVKESRGPGRAAFAVKEGDVAGEVVLLCRSAGRRASYEWQYRAGDGRWTDAEPTVKATSTITGLAPGTRYSFRTRARTTKGPGDWSHVISLLVV